MAFDIDGLAVLGSMAAHPQAFRGIEADASKIARTFLTKLLKDKATTLQSVQAMASALPDGTLAHVTDGMTDNEIAALAARFDRLNPELKATDRHGKAVLLSQLISGVAQPSEKPPGRKKEAGPKSKAGPKPSNGVEAATKVLKSKAMGARKTARGAGA